MLRAEAEDILLTDRTIVEKYFNYKLSQGLAMNMIFTISAMRQEQETLGCLATFLRRLDSTVYKKR